MRYSSSGYLRNNGKWRIILSPILIVSRSARLIALACGPAPEGRTRWTVSLLADQLVELRVVKSLGRTAVHRTLKK